MTDQVLKATARSDADLLQLIWLASPALPIGGFSYSEGLEAAVEAQYIQNESDVSQWLCDQLYLTQGRAELPVIAQAIQAYRTGDTARLHALNQWLLQTRESSEGRLQTLQMGSSFSGWQSSLGHSPHPVPDICYPMAFASAVAALSCSSRDGLLAYAFGWAENMTQAAIKSMPLGQSAGQRILLRLKTEIPGVVDSALQIQSDAYQAFAPMLAVLAAQHETQYSRLFRS